MSLPIPPTQLLWCAGAVQREGHSPSTMRLRMTYSPMGCTEPPTVDAANAAPSVPDPPGPSRFPPAGLLPTLAAGSRRFSEAPQCSACRRCGNSRRRSGPRIPRSVPTISQTRPSPSVDTDRGRSTLSSVLIRYSRFNTSPWATLPRTTMSSPPLAWFPLSMFKLRFVLDLWGGCWTCTIGRWDTLSELPLPRDSSLLTNHSRYAAIGARGGA